MNIADITAHLETIAPALYQEDYDNGGLIVGDASLGCTGVLVCLDCTEAVIEEARSKNCNLVVAHHPVIFGGLKKINGKDGVERTVINAIKNDIAIYAIHTNLDNMLSGVNAEIADRLGLMNRRGLLPRPGSLKKIYTFVPQTHLDAVREAVFSTGAGVIGQYSETAFVSEGTGSFKGNENTNPFVGE